MNYSFFVVFLTTNIKLKTYISYLDETPLRTIDLQAISGDISADSVLESSSKTVDS